MSFAAPQLRTPRAGVRHDAATELYEKLCSATPEDGRVSVDLGGSDRVDAVTLAALVAASRSLHGRGVSLDIEGAPSVASRVTQQLERPLEEENAASPNEGSTPVAARSGTEGAGVRILGETALDALRALVQVMLGRGGMPRGALTDQIVAMGADGTGIVALLAFLLGMILAFEGNAQLSALGAASLVPDVVAFSLVREFAPLLTAIVVIGRSGAAVASELATMTVDQEVAALRTMGIAPVSFLASPRILGMVLVQPALTLLASFVGMVGGLVTDLWVANASTVQFYDRAVASVGFDDVGYGLSKAVAFSAATSLASCAVGLNTRGAAAEVGTATTRAVVLSIFLLVVIDSVFAFTHDMVLP